jgi:hypothetical protein
MSVTDPSQPTATTPVTTTQVRGRAADSFTSRRELDETKASFLTTELWFTLLGVAALIVVYNVADDASLDLWRTCLLATVLGAAYLFSRGLAKSGSPRGRWYDDRPGDRY